MGHIITKFDLFESKKSKKPAKEKEECKEEGKEKKEEGKKGLSAKQKKLPEALQKAILKRMNK
jgi:hypothetical protein